MLPMYGGRCTQLINHHRRVFSVNGVSDCHIHLVDSCWLLYTTTLPQPAYCWVNSLSHNRGVVLVWVWGRWRALVPKHPFLHTVFILLCGLHKVRNGISCSKQIGVIMCCHIVVMLILTRKLILQNEVLYYIRVMKNVWWLLYLHA